MVRACSEWQRQCGLKHNIDKTKMHTDMHLNLRCLCIQARVTEGGTEADKGKADNGSSKQTEGAAVREAPERKGGVCIPGVAPALGCQQELKSIQQSCIAGTLSETLESILVW